VPPEQPAPQTPQFARSDMRSTHVSPQTVCWFGQWQVPARHIAPEAQALPQTPQFAWSVERSTQVPAHTDSGGGQEHALSRQISPGTESAQAASTCGSSSIRPSQSLSRPSQTSGEGEHWHTSPPSFPTELHTQPATQSWTDAHGVLQTFCPFERARQMPPGHIASVAHGAPVFAGGAGSQSPPWQVRAPWQVIPPQHACP
jgi:hypothetical protein